MAEAYATFAARGSTATRSRSARSTDPSGNRLPVPAADCQQVLDQNIADGMNELLQGVMTQRHRRPGRDRPPGGRQDGHHRQPVPRSGSSATRPTSRRRSGPATPARPRAATRCSNRARSAGVFYGDVCGGCLPGPIWQTDDERRPGGHPGRARSPTAEDNVRNGDSITGAARHRQVGRRGQGAAAGGQASTRSSAATRSTSPTRRPARSPTPHPGRDASAYPGQRVVTSTSAPAPPATRDHGPSGRRPAGGGRAPVRSPVPATPAAAPTGPAAG